MKPCYSPRFDDALVFAAEAFRHRRRKATDIPYMLHLMQVAVSVGEHGGNEVQMVAGLLHDYLEDIPGASEAELRTRFGDDVTDIVVALSDATSQPKPPWEERKRTYCARIANEPAATRLVCAADKLHNARSIHRDFQALGAQVWSRFSVPRERTLWYYREVIAALSSGWQHPILSELDDEVLALHRTVGEPWPERWS